MRRKQTKEQPSPSGDVAPEPLALSATQEGLPEPKSVIGQKTFFSPKGCKYQILKTTEQDETDPQPALRPTGKQSRRK